MAYGSRALMAALMVGAVASSTARAQDITIGTILPLTGPAAPIGVEEQQGVQFAIDRANAAGGVAGRKIVGIYEDSQGKPDVGVLSFNKLVDLRNAPIIITAFSSVSLAIAPLATRKRVLVVNAAAQSNQLAKASPYLINTIPLVREETGSIVNYMAKTLGKKKAAIVYENAAAGIDARDDFKQAFQKLGGTITDEEPVEFGQTNYRPALLKAASGKPDFVYFAVTQGHSTYVEQSRQIPDFPVGAGTTLVNPQFGYPGSVGWYQSAIRSQVSPELEAEFKAKFNVPSMSFFHREYYNATTIVLEAAASVIAKGQPVNGETVRAAIFDKKVFKSSIANLRFETSNTAIRGVEIQQYGPTERKVIAIEE